MSDVIGTFRIGEDLAVALDGVTGTVADVAAIVAKMVPGRLGPLGEFVAKPGAALITLDVAPRSASGSIPAGWNIGLAAAATASLAPGIYGIDAQLTGTSGVIEKTDTTAVVRLTRAVL
jgi:hypothetical protein